jgi:hypothetical protein
MIAGTGPNENPGNQLFRDTLKRYRDEYRSACSPMARRKIIATSIQDFKNQGGRFLRNISLHKDRNEDVAGPSGKTAFEVVEGAHVFSKARQAFRYLIKVNKEKKGSGESDGLQSLPASAVTVGTVASAPNGPASLRTQDASMRRGFSTPLERDQQSAPDAAQWPMTVGVRAEDTIPHIPRSYGDIDSRMMAEFARRNMPESSAGNFPFTLSAGISAAVPTQQSVQFSTLVALLASYSDRAGLQGNSVCIRSIDPCSRTNRFSNRPTNTSSFVSPAATNE